MSKKRKQESKKDRKKRIIHNHSANRDRFMAQDRERDRKKESEFFYNLKKEMGI